MIDVVRSDRPKSKGLDNKSSYSGRHVKRQLKLDFYSKCYLCEMTYSSEYPPQIDHLKPKKAFPEQEFEWENLFPVCDDCNNRRKSKWVQPYEKEDGSITHLYPKGGLLDPAKDEPEKRLHQELYVDKQISIEFSGVDSNDAQAKNTAEELNQIHLHADVRQNLSVQIVQIQKEIIDLLDCHRQGNLEIFEQEKRRFSRHFTKRAPYTSLLTSYFSRRNGLPLPLRTIFE